MAAAIQIRRALSTTTEPLVKLARHKNGVVVLTLNQPTQLNPLSEDMGRAFSARVDEISLDTSVRAVVLTGAGKAFSAGGDLRFLQDRIKTDKISNQAVMREFYERFLKLQDIPVPVIAAMNGAAVGAGFAVALACDIRIAAAKSKMGLNFVRLGITPGMGSSFTLSHVSNPQVAARLLLGGDLISSEEALRAGLLWSVEPPEQVLESAVKLADQIAEASPLAVRGTVSMLRKSRRHGEFQQSLESEAIHQSICYAAPDLSIGLEAVKTKATPTFSDVQTANPFKS